MEVCSMKEMETDNIGQVQQSKGYMFLAMALGMMCSGSIGGPQDVVASRVQENMSVQKMLITSPNSNKRFNTFDVADSDMEAKFDGMDLTDTLE